MANNRRKKPGQDDDEEEVKPPEQAGVKGEAPGEFGGPQRGQDTTDVDAEQAAREQQQRAEESLNAGLVNGQGSDRIEANKAASQGPAALDESTGAVAKKADDTKTGAEDFDRAMEAAKAKAQPAEKADQIVTGTLYAAGEGKVSLMTESKQEGKSFECDDGVPVDLAGTETHVGDLRRGDRVKLTGDPVTKIEAFRP